MKRKNFLAFGWLFKIGCPALVFGLVFGIIRMSLLLTNEQNLLFYFVYAIIIVLLIMFIIVMIFKNQIIVCCTDKIIAQELKSIIVEIEWKDVVDHGIMKFGFMKWIYVSNTLLTEEEKLKMLAANRKDSFIRFIYSKKAYALIESRISRNER